MQDTEALLPVQPGEVVADRFRVEHVLGTGGMAVVVSARHMQLDTLVAIKFLLPRVLRNADAVARFAREARAAVRIRSEHVARVLDVGTLKTGAPFIVMEYLDGRDIGRLVKEQGAQPVPVAVDLVVQACEALAEAHSLGIVHRDLKPANLFLVHRPDGSRMVKVLDFGISKIAKTDGSDASAAMTKTSTMIGSPLYMSPEQLASARDVDARADIWALGVILYELLCGQVPFEGDSVPQLCVRIMQGEPTSIRQLRPDVPSELESVVRRCMAKDRSDRYANVGELVLALAPFAPDHARVSIQRIVRLTPLAEGNAPGSSMAPPGRASVRSVVGATLGSWGHTALTDQRRRRARRILLVATGALSGIAGVLLVTRFGPRPSLPRAPSEAAALVPGSGSAVVEVAAVAPAVNPAASTEGAASLQDAGADERGRESDTAASAKPVVQPPARGALAPSGRPTKPRGPGRGSPPGAGEWERER